MVHCCKCLTSPTDDLQWSWWCHCTRPPCGGHSLCDVTRGIPIPSCPTYITRRVTKWYIPILGLWRSDRGFTRKLGDSYVGAHVLHMNLGWSGWVSSLSCFWFFCSFSFFSRFRVSNFCFPPVLRRASEALVLFIYLLEVKSGGGSYPVN